MQTIGHRTCKASRQSLAGARAASHRPKLPATHTLRAASSSGHQVADTVQTRTGGNVGGRNLVVAIDHSQEAWNAVEWTLQNLYRQGDVIHFIHVIPQGFSSVPQPTIHLHQPPMDDDTQEQVAEKAHAFITRTFVVLASKYSAQCEIDLVKGACREAIGAAICRKSTALSAAAVVVPGAKRSLWEEIFSGGSVARHVSAHCQQPTIILH